MSPQSPVFGVLFFVLEVAVVALRLTPWEIPSRSYSEIFSSFFFSLESERVRRFAQPNSAISGGKRTKGESSFKKKITKYGGYEEKNRKRLINLAKKKPPAYGNAGVFLEPSYSSVSLESYSQILKPLWLWKMQSWGGIGVTSAPGRAGHIALSGARGGSAGSPPGSPAPTQNTPSYTPLQLLTSGEL